MARLAFRAFSLGLRDVGAGHLADIEAVLGLAELFGQHIDVRLTQAHDGEVADHVDIGGNGVEER